MKPTASWKMPTKQAENLMKMKPVASWRGTTKQVEHLMKTKPVANWSMSGLKQTAHSKRPDWSKPRNSKRARISRKKTADWRTQKAMPTRCSISDPEGWTLKTAHSPRTIGQSPDR